MAARTAVTNGGSDTDGDRPGDPTSGSVGPATAAGSASALSAVPAAGSGRGRFAGGTVKFFHGPMDCGKSTLALQLHYNHSRQGRSGLLLTKLDRSGPARISSRIGISRSAVEVADDQDIVELVRGDWANGQRVDYLIVDEAQFFTADQVDQLAVLADDSQVDVYAFGIATDFRGRLFPGSARLFELADEVAPLQVEVLCWCGRIGRFNGRVVNGRIVREGATVRGRRHRRFAAGRRHRPVPGAVPDTPPLGRAGPGDRGRLTAAEPRPPAPAPGGSAVGSGGPGRGSGHPTHQLGHRTARLVFWLPGPNPPCWSAADRDQPRITTESCRETRHRRATRTSH